MNLAGRGRTSCSGRLGRAGSVRIARAVVSGLLGVLVTSTALVTAGAGSAGAVPPTSTIIDVSSSFTNNFDCSFNLQEQITGSVKDTQYFDQSGTIVKEILTAQYRGPVTVTWTNPVSGVMVSSHEADPLTIYYWEGHFASVSSRGLTFHVSIPGSGTVLLDVGRVVVTKGQGITFEFGQHQELNGDTAAFCAALS